MATPSKTWPKRRMWWCPTGPFSFLPIHVAGPYTRSGGPDLTKRILSSYTPTLRALLRARSLVRTSNDRQILIIAQSDTPGQAALPGASDEIQVIHDTARPKRVGEISILNGSDASKDAVLETLKHVSCAHFTCHGRQDQSGGALQSALYVHDGPLLLSISTRLAKADFAFLSACHTASGVDRLPDEAMQECWSPDSAV
jgi:CHAT domain-containing protein